MKQILHYFLKKVNLYKTLFMQKNQFDIKKIMVSINFKIMGNIIKKMENLIFIIQKIKQDKIIQKNRKLEILLNK